MRNYGLKIGDQVIYPIPDGELKGKVVGFDPMDNNAALVHFDGEKKPRWVVCEWCKVVKDNKA